MVNNIFRKGLVLGVLALFIGTFFIQNISGTFKIIDVDDDYNSDVLDASVLPSLIGNFDRIDFGNGSDGDVIISNDTILTQDMNYANLIVNNNVVLDTNGFLIKVAGTLTNYGTITDTFSGSDSGTGGTGGQGGDPWENSGGPEYPESGECGTEGEPPIYSQAGYGGDGGGSAGGGGGAWWYLLGQEEDADGGDGGDGGYGGDGGGYVRINAYNFNNTQDGIIHADGKNGINGQNGEDGEYLEWGLPGVMKDLAGGGGGGGAGGNSGDGGTIEIYYRNNLSTGEIHADGGNAGNGGSGGNGKQCTHTTVGGNKDPGAEGACGGGTGGEGEFQILQWSEGGEDGNNGVSGSDGNVTFLPAPNQPPSAPIIDGPLHGKPGIEYDYTFTSIDPDDDDVLYYIKWGDDLNDLTNYYASGEPATVSHIYTSPDNYTIETMAVDIHGDESNWSNLTVTMPRNKAVNIPFLKLFLQQTNLFLLLQKLFKEIKNR